MLPHRPFLHALLAALVIFQIRASVACAAEEPLRAATDSVTAAELQDHVATLADDVFEGRAVGSRGGRAAAQYIVRQLRASRLTPAGVEDGYFQPCDRGGRNILALWPGSDPVLKNEFIVVGAHYDHVGDGRLGHANGPIGYIYNGADDNASGCAALLETIEALSDAGVDTRRSILFAFWDGEEMGMVGSNHWFDAPTIPPSAIRLAINIDMIGRLRNGRLEVDGTRTGYGLRRFLSRADDDSTWLDFSWELTANSDHWPFLEHRIPVVLLHTGVHPDYHRPSDDADKINHAGLESVTRYLLDTVVASADADRLPAYRPAHRFESLAAQRSRSQRDAVTSRGDWPGANPPRLGISWRTDEAQPESVYLTHVAVNSPAEAAGLAFGDRIYAVNGQSFSNEKDFRDTVFGLLDSAAAEFTLLVETRGHVRTIHVHRQPQTLAARTGT
jgi:hypothetical protein